MNHACLVQCTCLSPPMCVFHHASPLQMPTSWMYIVSSRTDDCIHSTQVISRIHSFPLHRSTFSFRLVGLVPIDFTVLGVDAGVAVHLLAASPTAQTKRHGAAEVKAVVVVVVSFSPSEVNDHVITMETHVGMGNSPKRKQFSGKNLCMVSNHVSFSFRPPNSVALSVNGLSVRPDFRNCLDPRLHHSHSPRRNHSHSHNRT